MNLKRVTRNLSFLICLSQAAAAQHEQFWAFGTVCGLDFSSGTAVVATSKIETYESCASVTDENGNLLFYTDGTCIRNRNHNLMPNGSGLTPFTGPTMLVTGSSAQGSIIIPIPDEADKYFVFSLTQFEMGTDCGRLYYSKVDMSLNNGLGDVVAGQKAILLDTGLTEQMTGVAGNDCGTTWLLTVSKQGYLKSHLIDRNGISATPVQSPIQSAANIRAVIVVSPDRTKLISTMPRLTLYDFNAATGMVSNPVTLENTDFYGAAFSKDNTKVYAGNFSPAVYQFDLSAGNARTLLGPYGRAGMKLGPDDKIYISDLYHKTMHVIQQPNVAGTACQLVPSAINFTFPSVIGLGLPNVVPAHPRETLTRHTTDTLSCDVRQYLCTAADTTGWGYIWSDGSTGNTYTATSAGTYVVRYQKPCRVHYDSFTVYTRNSDSSSRADSICSGSSYAFNGRLLQQSGIYRDTFTSASGCDSVVTLRLHVIPAPELQISDNRDSRLCIGDTLYLSASGATQYQWTDDAGNRLGSGTQLVLPLTGDSKQVTVSGNSGGCSGAASTQVFARNCCSLFVPNAFTPNQDGRNDVFRVSGEKKIRKFRIDIFNRWGELVFTSDRMADAWNGNYKGMPAETGTYFYQVYSTCPDGTDMYQKGDLTLIR